MKAIQLVEPTGTDALTYEDVPRPDPESDELLIQVHAAGVNPLDWLISRGMVQHLLDEPLPWIPGWDISGVVVSVGAAVSDFDPGDPVYGMVRLPGAGGAFAEYTTMTAEEITSKPHSLSHVEAASVPMAGQTAFHALHEAAGLNAGQRVLIHAAAGGVGHLAVQFAANTGAYVIGTASGYNETYLRDLGVDQFVNYREERFDEILSSVDIVLDSIGGEVLDRSVDVVDSGGVIVTLPEAPPEEKIKSVRDEHDVDIRFFSVTTHTDPATLQLVTAHIDAGVAEPTISDTYPLSKVEDALDRSADGHVRGKLVIDVTEGSHD